MRHYKNYRVNKKYKIYICEYVYNILAAVKCDTAYYCNIGFAEQMILNTNNKYLYGIINVFKCWA